MSGNDLPQSPEKCDAVRGMENWQPRCDLPAGHEGAHRWTGPSLLVSAWEALRAEVARERAAREAAESAQRGFMSALADTARERDASRSEAEGLRAALDSAVYVMTYSATALRNGGGTGHEVVRLEEGAASAVRALAGPGAATAGAHDGSNEEG